MNFSSEESLTVNGVVFRVFIYKEWRRNARASIGKKGIYIRLPLFMRRGQQQQQIRIFLDWAKKKIEHKSIRKSIVKPSYENHQKLTLFDRVLTVQINHTDTKSDSYIDLQNNKLHLFLVENLSEETRQKEMSLLVKKALKEHYTPIVTKNLQELNHRYQLGVLHTVRLKDNTSNWGSCSSKGNINISIRLLFAPKPVYRYVLIHELVHLKIRNHSSDFWAEVEALCPAYRQHKIWLKEQGHSIVV